jgi:TnpA family transposase
VNRRFTQLNRGEGRHRLARKCFHGQRGELWQRYREGQEDQLGALGLVVNALVLWNTRYMDAALSHLRSQSAEARILTAPQFDLRYLRASKLPRRDKKRLA